MRRAFIIGIAISAAACREARPGARDSAAMRALSVSVKPLPSAAPTATQAGHAAPAVQPAVQHVWLTAERRAQEDTLFQSAARTAWRFIDRNYVPETGLVKPYPSYTISTMWDIASGLGGLFAGKELGFIDRAEYDRRMGRALETLGHLKLFQAAFNKEYDTQSGRIIGITQHPSGDGYGASAMDTGRLLLWLKVIANRDPEHRAAIENIVSRLDLEQFVNDGYLEGRQLSLRTGRLRKYQEGRLGYEQYAAKGFAAWGVKADKALDIGQNLETKKVSGVMVPADSRGGDRLTSEPFVLMGMEAGFNQIEQVAAEAVLRAQEARYKATDTLTLVSEDAIDIAPDYFFYYTILSRHGPWSIDVQRPNARGPFPRWLSAKAAFAWHALMPDDYTRQVVDTVMRRARVDDAWGAGVYDNGRPTGTPNLNTADGVLEAALYRRFGTPFLQLTSADSSASDAGPKKIAATTR